MKKISLIMAVILAISLIGCGKSDKTESAKPAEKSTANNEDMTLNDADVSKLVKLGPYKGLEISVNSTAVTQEDIDEQIKNALYSEAERVEVTDRNVQKGDIVNIDYEGKKDGVPFQGGTAKGHDLTIGSGVFIDGFEDGLIGAKKGETMDLYLTFPENYGNPELSGQDVVFTVTVNSIQEDKIPELTDELAKKINPDVKTADEFKKYIKESLEKAAQDASRNAAYSDLLNMVDASSSVVSGDEIPASIMDEIVKIEKAGLESMITAYGMDIDTYIKSQGLTQEEYDEQIRTYSEGVARQELLIRALAKAENIEVTDADLEEQYKNYAQEYGYSSPEDFKKAVEAQNGQETLKEAVLTRKVEEMLFDNAKISNPEEVTWK